MGACFVLLTPGATIPSYTFDGHLSFLPQTKNARKELVSSNHMEAAAFFLFLHKLLMDIA